MEINLLVDNRDSACSSRIVKFKPYEIYKQINMEVDVSKEIPIKNECNNECKRCNVKEHKVNNLQKNHVQYENNFDDIIFILILFLVLQMTCSRH